MASRYNERIRRPDSLASCNITCAKRRTMLIRLIYDQHVSRIKRIYENRAIIGNNDYFVHLSYLVKRTTQREELTRVSSNEFDQIDADVDSRFSGKMDHEETGKEFIIGKREKNLRASIRYACRVHVTKTHAVRTLAKRPAKHAESLLIEES
jgi:hypothetical protein